MHGCHASWYLDAAKHQMFEELTALPKKASLVWDDLRAPGLSRLGLSYHQVHRMTLLSPSAQDDAAFASLLKCLRKLPRAG